MVEVCGKNFCYWNYCSVLEINLYLITGTLVHKPDSVLCKILNKIVMLII